MNVPIIDPLQGDFPEVIEEFLEHGVMKCIAFNRRGTLLAAGCSDGSCVIWDFETRGISKELRDKDCVAPITSVCWSRYGHRILAAATDKSLTLWDVANGEKIARTTLQQTTLHAQLHPGSCTPSECLACPLSSAPVLVDLNTGSMTYLPVSFIDAPGTTYALPNCRNKFADGSPPFTPTAASFSKYGDLIYVGNSKGEIIIMSSRYIKVYAIISVPGGAVIKNIVFSRNGRYLLTNSNDRTIRVYTNPLPMKDEVKVLEEMKNGMDEKLPGVEKLKAVGKKCLLFYREFQDSVTRIHWKAPCFSGDGEWVVGASASKGEHKIYIWARGGHLVKILEGPKEAITDLAWHPVHPIVVSVSLSGLVYIWAKDYTENWSAFAPDFKELDENEEYVEREDEFDLMPETEKVKDADINEEEEVDIVTVEKNPAFSDSEASQDELCFLPTIPMADVPEHKDDDFLGGSPSKLEESTQIGSPHSELGAQNGQDLKPPTLRSLVEEDECVELDVRVKRKRKPSEKGLELQAEKGRKPFSKLKSSGKKKSKSKKKADEEEYDTNEYVFEEDETD